MNWNCCWNWVACFLVQGRLNLDHCKFFRTIPLCCRTHSHDSIYPPTIKEETSYVRQGTAKYNTCSSLNRFFGLNNIQAKKGNVRQTPSFFTSLWLANTILADKYKNLSDFWLYYNDQGYALKVVVRAKHRIKVVSIHCWVWVRWVLVGSKHQDSRHRRHLAGTNLRPQDLFAFQCGGGRRDDTKKEREWGKDPKAFWSFVLSCLVETQ